MPVVQLQRDNRGAVPLWSFPGLSLPGLTLAVTSREGGVSSGAFGTFNLGTHVGDNPAAVAVNALMLSSVFGGEGVTFVTQVHGAEVVECSTATSDTHGDAIIVREGDRAAGVRVADCVPIAIIDRRQRVGAVVHAGWRGLAAEIIEESIRVLASRPEDLVAAVGPSISRASYQVGPEVVASHADFAQHARADIDDRFRLDLRAVTVTQLTRAGVAIDHQWISHDVTDGGERFFSDRAQRPCGRFALIMKWES